MDYKRESRIKTDFIYSSLTEENKFQKTEEFLNWLKIRKEKINFSVNKIPLHKLEKWYFQSKTENLVHESGKFFSIIGIDVLTDYGHKTSWDQPIINQPEIGILGIITKNIDGKKYFLMQAKMEPGNINTLQLSPTVQSTKSNYTRAHQGKTPLYLEYFLDKSKSKILIDNLQTEQGGRFLRKRNRNMIVEINEDIPIHNDFCWLTLGQIKKLMKTDNLVNMDARSVISCINFFNEDIYRKYDGKINEIMKDPLFLNINNELGRDLLISIYDRENNLNTLNDIIHWFNYIKSKYELNVREIGLNKLRDWFITPDEIKHKSGKFFSIIGVDVKANNREVSSWTQPLIKHRSRGLVGFISKKINGILHFLIQARLEPGSFSIFELSPTFACSNFNDKIDSSKNYLFFDMFSNPPKEKIKYSCIQSDEGGRFYHSENEYILLEIEKNELNEIPENYNWLTLGQIMELIKHNYLNIDVRVFISLLGFI